VILPFVAWSPIRRTNVGCFEVEQPKDYATVNSNQLRDETGWDSVLVDKFRMYRYRFVRRIHRCHRSSSRAVTNGKKPSA
jgi:hypothetical protein